MRTDSRNNLVAGHHMRIDSATNNQEHIMFTIITKRVKNNLTSIRIWAGNEELLYKLWDELDEFGWSDEGSKGNLHYIIKSDVVEKFMSDVEKAKQQII